MSKGIQAQKAQKNETLYKGFLRKTQVADMYGVTPETLRSYLIRACGGVDKFEQRFPEYESYRFFIPLETGWILENFGYPEKVVVIVSEVIA